MMALISGRLPFFMPFVLIPLLCWLYVRPSSPLRPQLSEQCFSPAEKTLWLSGAGLCALAMLAYAYVAGDRGSRELFRAAVMGGSIWAFGFLTIRDCRHAIQLQQPDHAPPGLGR